jgi:hypothetical protein
MDHNNAVLPLLTMKTPKPKKARSLSFDHQVVVGYVPSLSFHAVFVSNMHKNSTPPSCPIS